MEFGMSHMIKPKRKMCAFQCPKFGAICVQSTQKKNTVMELCSVFEAET